MNNGQCIRIVAAHRDIVAAWEGREVALSREAEQALKDEDE
jgi:hypothetical protein